MSTKSNGVEREVFRFDIEAAVLPKMAGADEELREMIDAALDMIADAYARGGPAAAADTTHAIGEFVNRKPAKTC